jgi:hypothetical protein
LRLEKVLHRELAAIAAGLGIAAEVVATRRELSALARGVRELPVLRGWRQGAAGERLLAALAC